VLAVDVPSGLSAETGEPQGAAILATVTLTVGAPKWGLCALSAPSHVGRLEVADDVGLTPCPFTSEIQWTMAGDFAGFPPIRAAAGHKGTFGHLSIIAGSLGYHGAAILAARGAQRARPGLITLFPHETAYQACAAQSQAVMVQPWSNTSQFPGEFSALLAGPGLAFPDLPSELKQTVQRLWTGAPIPLVVDAGALSWLPTGPTPENTIRVITPHPGEAARLLKKTPAEVQANRLAALRELSHQFGNCWVVLKGHQTLVGRSSDAVFVNSSGNPHLAQGGSGDVLAGYLAGLLAQPPLQYDVFQTIRYAVWQHGATADALQITKPNWIIEDLLEALGLNR
jgi:NAD(P)H-hydrate epimerase